ncbi:MAG: protein-glutamate O-methyltransferase [Alphaproteobacteria bacterium]|jgi:chemotaxis protein methyltransferase CheR|uniref:CheR family methyltransferase n=1 Tax=Pacificispira sp. TaxID=2888761 RepID=UPI001B205D2C|nr:protein-glutamate O-methyltransferase [Alphaproteobacteria bacterium]MBO6862664.1 protein-glutamate O-methyltransferase [Alphaproteobacteria bacterium]MEC9268009.1 protein-glutamate O-methyltransferase [Pseudomonadota bacterium]
MKIEDFDMLATLLKQRSGLVLTKDKAYLLETRLMPVARKHGMKDLDQLCDAVRLRKDAKVIADITEAMTTNESLFFRDTKPFDQFRNVVLPQLMINRAATRKIRIWSAACSSGQEPYSLAMILKEDQAKLQGWRFEIVATDISEEMLAKARAGIYTQFEVQRGLPIQMLVKYFKQNGDKWHIDAGLRSMIDYRPFNLLEHPRGLGNFDIVFCRNVLIYFDQPTKAKVLGQVSDVLAKDGVLYLGGAETVLGVTEKFKPVPNLRGMYQHSDGTPAVKVA